ncbi:MAG: SIS domain-containing protein [Alphaproteobacteria bacterium]|nr:SIS domain-containing protein [Alphaproteobacteria bacterium]
MFRESAEAPRIVAAMLEKNRDQVARLGGRLRALAPHAVVTGARGSSDNAATFAKYLIETKTGTLTSSAGLSISSLYTAHPKLDGTVFLAISQSGKSPDLLKTVEAARQAGALVLAIVNDETSPLAALAHEMFALHAGPECSIAATKTWIASVAAVAQLVAAWSGDGELETALATLPEQLDRAWSLDWGAMADRLKDARDLYVVGRGMGFGTAQEAALKLKETCGLHAEAFSAAEVRHGPMALVRQNFPVLMFAQDDETMQGVAELAESFIKARALLITAGLPCTGALVLPSLRAHPVLQPILVAQSFYRAANALAFARGIDPDHPPLLNKITETV